MKKNLFLIVIFLFTLMMTHCRPPSRLEYPDTRMDDVVDTYFGVEVADPFRWLEDDNSEETKAWVTAQNEVTFGYLERIPFRRQIHDRLTKVWDHERFGVPFWKNDLYFYFRNDGMQNQSVLYVREGLEGEPRVFIDPNTFSEDGTVSLTGLSLSDDARYMAYGISRGGSDWNELFVREVATGEDLDDHIRWAKFSGIAWKDDGFYYSRYDTPPPGEELSAPNEHHQLWYHRLGTSQEEDRLVYRNPDHPRRNYSALTTEDERFLVMVEMESSVGNALWIKDLDRPGARFQHLIGDLQHNNRVVDHINGRFLVMTNYQAPLYRLVLVDPARPQPAHWQDVIPEGAHLLRGVSLVGGRIVANYLVDVVSRLYVYDMQGNRLSGIELPGAGSVGGFSGKKDESTAFFAYTSFNYPTTIFKFDMQTGTYEEYFRPAIDFDPEKYESKQVFYTSADGTRVPMFITHKKGLKLDGNNPTLLYGYGGFNVSMTPGFSLARILLLENGGVYAVANIRGGGEFGREWHDAGKQLNKQNGFDDFIAAAEYLIAEGYTSSEKLAIQGGSNGGLLVGAVANQRPDLFAVALPAVGVMDMLRYHLFTIGWAWAGDYGTSEDSVHFHNLYAYSPLHNIREGVNYPATLVTTADHDDRVVPAHSFKYIAELQRRHAGPNPVLIRIETQAGHGAGTSTEKLIEELTDVYAFTLYNLGFRRLNKR